MIWWSWLLLGLALIFVEVMTPGGFFFMFFGASALAVGALAGFGLGPTELQLLVFSVLSVGSLLLFRGPLMRRLERHVKPEHRVDSIPGEIATLTEDLPPHGTGQALLRGTVWNVQNAAGEPMSKGQRCRVERLDGLKLIVRPE
jgi:membrane protein implicated in regulation of membrane protease activity